VFFVDTFAISSSGIVAVQEYDSSSAPRARSVSAKTTALLARARRTRCWLVLVLVLGLFLFGLVCCRPPAVPEALADVAASIETPPGVALVAACVPSGPELCFNAIDDNCNGVIDEGCGLSTGIVQFTIAWGDSKADVNVHVTPPPTMPGDRTQERAFFNRDKDCPRDPSCYGQNEENVFYDGHEPPRGRVMVTIDLGDPKDAPLPVHVRFGARIGSKSYGAEVILEKRGDKKVFTFTM